MHGNCLTNEGPGNSENSMAHDFNLIKPGEYHNECIQQVWDWSPQQFVQKCMKIIWQITGQEMIRIQWSITKSYSEMGVPWWMHLPSFRSTPRAICLEMHQNHKIMTNGLIDERVNVAGDSKVRAPLKLACHWRKQLYISWQYLKDLKLTRMPVAEKPTFLMSPRECLPPPDKWGLWCTWLKHT